MNCNKKFDVRVSSLTELADHESALTRSIRFDSWRSGTDLLIACCVAGKLPDPVLAPEIVAAQKAR